MSFEALLAGLPTSAIDMVSSVLEEVYHDVSCEVIDVSSNLVRVRKSIDNSNVVFVCFDSSSKRAAEKIAKELYSDEKFYEYTNDVSLAAYLRTTFGVEVEEPQEQFIGDYSSNSSGDLDDFDEFDREFGAPSGESFGLGEPQRVPDAKDDGLGLIAPGMVPESVVGSLRLQIQNLEAQNRELRASLEDVDDSSILNKRINELEKSLNQSELVRSQLQKQLSGLKSQVSADKATIEVYESNSREHDQRISALDRNFRALEEENKSLRGFKARAEEMVSSTNTLKAALESIQGVNSDLKNRVDSLSQENEALKARVSAVGSRDKEVSELESHNKKLTDDLLSANTQITELGVQVRNLEQSLRLAESNQVDADRISELQQEVNRLSGENLTKADRINTLEEELAKLQEEASDKVSLEEMEGYAEFKDSIYSRMGSESMPRSTPSPLVELNSPVKKVAFAFSGSKASNTDSYRCISRFIKNIVEKRPGQRLVFLDLGNESFADYSFGVRSNENVIEWLDSGGAIENYMLPAGSRVGGSNVFVLSPGAMGWNNDLYLTKIDLKSRILELEASGYNTVVYGGDLGSYIGRALFRTVNGFGSIRAYTDGSMASLRNTLYNFQQLQPRDPKPSVGIYNYVDNSRARSILAAYENLGLKVDFEKPLIRGGSNG